MIAYSSQKFAAMHLFLASAVFLLLLASPALSRAVKGIRGYSTDGLEQLESFRRESE